MEAAAGSAKGTAVSDAPGAVGGAKGAEKKRAAPKGWTARNI
jgi:hypothetical protein